MGQSVVLLGATRVPFGKSGAKVKPSQHKEKFRFEIFSFFCSGSSRKAPVPLLEQLLVVEHIVKPFVVIGKGRQVVVTSISNGKKPNLFGRNGL